MKPLRDLKISKYVEYLMPDRSVVARCAMCAIYSSRLIFVHGIT